MGKTRRTVSLDPEVDDQLSKEGVNASELVNKLVKQHSAAGGNDRAMLELREQQLESELSELESRVESKRAELEQVRDRLSEYRTEQEAVLDEARNTLTSVPRDPENPAIQRWAEKADMGPEEFLTALSEDST